MEPTENDPITRRLHSLGNQPIDPEVVVSHRNLMASVPVAPSRSRLRPLMVGSLLAGSLLGGVGLAAAGPGVVADSASNVAKAVVAAVSGENEKEDADKSPAARAAAQQAKVARAEAKEAKKAARAANHPAGTHGVARSDDGCLNGFDGSASNHGQYVSSVAKTPGVTEEQKTTAAQSDCGKPVHAGNDGAPVATGNDPGATGNDADGPGKSNLPHGRGDTGKPEASGSSAPGRSGEHRADAGPAPAATPGS